jgi:hypothetical protein
MDPFGPLTLADFPLTNIGPCVYRKTCSSPVFTAPNDMVAADLVTRINRDHFNGMTGAAPWREQQAAQESSTIPVGSLVFGSR